MSFTDKKALVFKVKACFKCLEPGHMSNACPKTTKCETCASTKHNTHFHGYKKWLALACMGVRFNAIRPVVPVIAFNGDRSILVYAMYDTAATAPAGLLEVADAIGAEIASEPCNLAKFNSYNLRS